MKALTGAPAPPLGLDDLACPICVETIEDAFATPCGHTFCYKCISTHLKNKSNCPSCGAHLVQDNIHPNFLLRKLIKQAANNRPSLKTALLQHVQHDLAIGDSIIGLQELDSAIHLLQDRRQQVATQESSNKLQLLLMFLQHAKAKQEGKLSELEQQLDALQHDLDKAVQQQPQQEQQQQQQQQQNGVAAATEPTAVNAPADPATAVAVAAKQDAVPSSSAADVATGAGVSDAQGVLQQQQQQQQQQEGMQQQPAVGGPGSAFRKLGSIPLQQQQQQQQQQEQQSLAGQQQPVWERQLPQQQSAAPAPATAQPQQQQPQPHALQQRQMPPPPRQSPQPVQQPQQQQQQPPAVGFRPLGFHPVSSQGFRPFTAQQQLQHPDQPPNQLQKSNSLLQQQQQPLQQQQQGTFRPYGSSSSGSILAGLPPQSAGTAVQQTQQQQQQGTGFRDLGMGGRSTSPPAASAGDVSGGYPGRNTADKKRKAMQQYDHKDTQVKRASGESAGPSTQQMLAAAGQGTLQQQHGLMDHHRSSSAGVTPQYDHAFGDFSGVLSAATNHVSLKHLAYVPHSRSKGNIGSSAAHILSTIEFDCLGQLFATAGVQQRICIYDYNAITAAAAADVYHQQHPQLENDLAAGSSATAIGISPFSPMLDLPTRSKISCTSFSPVVQQYLLSSDYEGLVHLWDLEGAKIVRQWEAHEKRIWAVDCCPVLQDQFATGSDDGLVKIWGVRDPPVPRLTLPVNVNVCSLEYNPVSQYLLAVGSAGHQVHIFDLRSPNKALAVLKGHRKAVSYVRWAGADQLVTASTDSTLRLWSTAAAAAAGSSGADAAGVMSSSSGCSDEQQQQSGWRCSQVFHGHTNLKHFVGLSTHAQFVACGSETNEVFLYKQSLPTPSLRYKLVVPGSPAAPADDGSAPKMSVGTAASSNSSNSKNPFVSAVCWRSDSATSEVLLAANSQGGVWLLSMAPGSSS